MLDPRPLQARIQTRLRQALQNGPDGGLFTVTLAVPELTLRGLPPLRSPYLYWARPDAHHYMLGLGHAATVTADGPGRMVRLDGALRRRAADWTWLDEDDTGVEPAAFAAFAFDANDGMEGPWSGFPNAVLQIPALTVQRQGNLCVLAFTWDRDVARDSERMLDAASERFETLLEALVQPPQPSGRRTPLECAAARDPDGWPDIVDDATAAIGRGMLEKVVPARRIRVCAERRLDAPRLMTTLAYRYPSCTLLAMNFGGRTFASATPERLAACVGGELVSDAVGGTIRRAAAESDDERLGAELLADPKTRHEHALVVDFLHDSLRPLCEEMTVPPRPELLKLRNLQHLWTRVRGRARDGVSLLQVAARLHPTPAVGGLPVDAAADWLRTNERLQRGWYTGAAGWIDRGGDGELAVLLRCALLEDRCAYLYAGAGVVADSDADAELAETELKFGAILEALEDA